VIIWLSWLSSSISAPASFIELECPSAPGHAHFWFSEEKCADGGANGPCGLVSGTLNFDITWSGGVELDVCVHDKDSLLHGGDGVACHKFAGGNDSHAFDFDAYACYGESSVNISILTINGERCSLAIVSLDAGVRECPSVSDGGGSTNDAGIESEDASAIGTYDTDDNGLSREVEVESERLGCGCKSCSVNRSDSIGAECLLYMAVLVIAIRGSWRPEDRKESQ
jgi:hypothetical protein